MVCGGSGYEAAKSIRSRIGRKAQMSGKRDEKGREWSRGAKGLPQTVNGLIPSVGWDGFSLMLVVLLVL